MNRLGLELPIDIVNCITRMKALCSLNQADFVEWKIRQIVIFLQMRFMLCYQRLRNWRATTFSRAFGNGQDFNTSSFTYGRLGNKFFPQMSLICVHRHMARIDTCPLCNEETESLEHALKDCKWTKHVWMTFNIHNNSLFFQSEIINWLHVNIVKQLASIT